MWHNSEGKAVRAGRTHCGGSRGWVVIHRIVHGDDDDCDGDDCRGGGAGEGRDGQLSEFEANLVPGQPGL